MADRKKRFRIALIVVVAVSVVVCPLALGGWGLRQGAYAEGGRQQGITFVPSIANLELTRTVEGLGLDLVETLEPGVAPVETHIPVTDEAWIVEGLTSAEALALCSNRSHWGDEQMGMCVAPGGETYYVWIEPDQVVEVGMNTDPENPWQEAFQTDVEQVTNERAAIAIAQVEVFGSGIGFFMSLAAVVPLCASLAGCFISPLGVTGTLALLLASHDSLMSHVESLDDRSRSAVYSYCMMLGNEDGYCDSVAGIT